MIICVTPGKNINNNSIFLYYYHNYDSCLQMLPVDSYAETTKHNSKIKNV